MPKQTPQLIISAKKTTASRASQYSAGATSGVETVGDHLHDGTSGSGGDLAVYLKADGTIAGAVGGAQVFSNGIVGPSWKPAADSTTALQLQNAAGTGILYVDTTNNLVGINGQPDNGTFYVNVGTGGSGKGLRLNLSAENASASNRYTSIDFRVYTSLLVGQFFATGATYVNAGINLPASSCAFFAENANGTLALGAVGANGDIRLQTGGYGTANERVRITSAGLFGVGIQVPATQGHIVSTTATTNARRDILTLGANVTSTGVGAAGLGVGILLQAESSTTVDTLQAMIATEWLVATHASRTARLSLSAYDTAAREGLRIEADGAAARLGLYGVAAIARPTNAIAAAAFVANTSGIVNDTATWGGYTMGQVVQALQNLGALT